MCKLFEVFDAKYRQIDDEQKRFMSADELRPYQILADWVADGCNSFDNYTVTKMLNFFSELDSSYEGFHQCVRALQGQAGDRSP